ncbi:UDP-N-acetylmuramate dehydrogenase [Prevotella sp. oral taxon 376]|uniref:UDP-N-acetylmuramate dehydrogenase n=1 Tax=Prevotella sp. oral taxon 376 TaxID=712466 RepID=UPI000D1E7C1E|nr:UDP-N-acetylmuramate dehydrogenase [Prevotella sp. oral taxon 376]PTL32918.1 UDP-N-acetylmuramate dehydrogenase [Prevotella sp. oral taxon 376]
MKDLKSYSLLRHNTFGIDAKCDRFLEYASVDEAVEIVRSLKNTDRPLLLLGGGSNLLLTGDYHGTVITPENRFEVVESEGAGNGDSVYLHCWAGTTFDEVVAYAVKQGCYGMENLSLIPGQVGASAIQNIGAYGVEAKDFIDEVRAIEIATGNLVVFGNDDCEYGYRQSKFKHAWKDRFLMLQVTYKLSRTFVPKLDYGNIRMKLEEKGIGRPTAQQLRDVIIEIRREKLPDPEILGNAGSFFMNPVVSRRKYEKLAAEYPGMPHYTIDGEHEKIPAGWMIEQCGWKGRALGKAGVHSRQALILVNLGGATGTDILDLCEAVRKDVKHKFDIEIYPEVNIR